MKNNAKKLVEILEKEELTIGSVESFTGGLFGKEITDVDGASNVYKGGLIVYSNELKEKLLGIKKELIEENGAVSWPVAQAMAINGLDVLGVDICVSFTGNAGPSICDDKEELGVCYMGIAFNGQIWSIPLRLSDLDREQIREVCTDAIINAVTSILAK